MSEGGFWKPTPYICLSKNYHFSETKATLEEHIVIDNEGSYKLYRFWNHYKGIGKTGSDVKLILDCRQLLAEEEMLSMSNEI